MFKFVLVCALFAIVFSSPIPDEVRKTANIQKTSEYFLTAESIPPAPKSSGLTRPSPINPNIQSDPKPQDSGKIVPASLTDGNSKTVIQPVPKEQSSGASSRTPSRTVNTDRHVAEATNLESAKVPAPVSPVSSVQKIDNPSVSRTAQVNNNNNRPTVVTANPAAHLDSNPSIASPASGAKSSTPIIVGAERKIVKRENSPAKHLDHDSTSSAAATDSDSTSHKNNDKPSKSSSLSSNNDDSYSRDNQPPKYVHPVPVTQIIKDSPPAEIHQHKDE